MEQERPDPDRLLADVQEHEAKQRRGRLKVFFGMSAGVGKTYAMLEEARARAAEGMNVLVGYAEPHIRPDTEALMLGLDILPYKVVEYRGAKLKEFDLDGALRRKPTLILVDELAHTNAPGMRHPKRWQDVMELLDAGMSVYTTLNVQHIESVNDIVERVTGVKVQETLPDVMLERADEVELVDIAPEELLERFREGKIYRLDQAERAAKHFFTKGNLTALRELALRTTAERVDAQMLEARREAGVQATWPTTERVLVCVSPSPMSRRLVRSAKRLANSLRAEWIAAYVETPKSRNLSSRDRLRVEGTLRLAEQLGATTVTLSGMKVSEEVVAYAQVRNVTKIVIGKPARPRWHEVVFGSVVDDLVRHSGQIDIHVIRGEVDEEGLEPQRRGDGRFHSRRDWTGYGWATFVTVLATALGWPLYYYVGLSNANVLMLYLLGVLWVATHCSRGAAVLASILSVLAFDLCFVPPYLTLSVSDRQYVVTFSIMLLTALVISTLTHRVRAQAEAARHRERRTAALLALSRELASVRTVEEIVASTVRQVTNLIGGRTVVLMPGDDHRLLVKGEGKTQPCELDAKETGVAQWAFEHDRIAGRGTDTLPAAARTYVPLKTARSTVGVLAVASPDDAAGWSMEQGQLIEAFASQAALALERAALAEEARQAWEQVEAEFLRNTLLSGVSHELRTPLAAITGAATALIETGPSLPSEAQAEMLDTIYTESERMDRLITNLLDMTRLESGGLSLKKEWQPIQEVIGSALHHLDRRLQGRPVNVRLAPNMPPVQIDAVAIEQVLTNLIDNAVEYTPMYSPVEITAEASENEVAVEVMDRGPGLPEGTQKRVFEKFFRARPSETRRGIGLGLAICRGIVEAHGGTIIATNRAGGGALFRFTLPRSQPPPEPPGTW